METTATPTVTPLAAGIRFGVIFGIAGVLLDMLLKVTGLSFKYSVSLTAMVVLLVVAFIMAHRYYKAHNQGFMSYGQGLLIAVVAAAIMGLFTGISNYVYINFVDPNYADAMRADMEAWMASMNAPEEQIEKSLKDVNKEKLGSPMNIGTAILSQAFTGLLLGLIVSAITKRNRPEFE